MPDPRILSLDTESFGAFEHNAHGKPLPPQEHFHPHRMMLQQGVALEDLNLLASITLPKREAPLHKLEPGPTMVFELHKQKDRLLLTQWLSHAHTVLGSNLIYDLLMLRADPYFRPLLPLLSKTVIDYVCLNFQLSDVTTERGLKESGPLLGTHRYDRSLTLKDGQRFPSPTHSSAHDYAAEDSHNVILGTAEICRRIRADYTPRPSTLNPTGTCAKLTPLSLGFWSDLSWFVVALSESGIPLHRPSLESLARTWHTRATEAHALSSSLGVPLEGKGSEAPQDTFVEGITTLLNSHPTHLTHLLGVDRLEAHPLFAITEKKGKVSTKYSNRLLLTTLLESLPCPPTSNPDSRSTSSEPTPTASTPTSSTSSTELSPTPVSGGLAVMTPSSLESPATNDRQTSLHILKLWNAHTDGQGFLSKVSSPLLERKRAKDSKSPFASLLLRLPALPPGIEIAYPKWYPYPSTFAKGDTSSKGQKQGRKSAADPAIQQWEAQTKACIRSRFTPGAIVSFDLGQLELRVPAVLSGEPSLVSAFTNNEDLHAARAIRCFGPSITTSPHWKSKSNPWEDPRQWAKTFNFEDLYLAGAGKMQAKLFEDSGKILPLSFFRDVVRDRPLLRPVLTEWQNRLISEAHRDGYLILPFTGHSRLFYGGDHKPNEIVNFPIQTTGAITMAMIEHEILRRSVGAPWRFIMDIHDALFADVPVPLIAQYKSVVASAITYVQDSGYWSWICNLYGNFVPLKYDFHITLTPTG